MRSADDVSALDDALHEDRVAMLTAWDGALSVNRGYRCALLAWCSAARRLGDVLEQTVNVSVDVIVLITLANRAQWAKASAALATECPALTRAIAAPDELRDAVNDYAEHRIRYLEKNMNAERARYGRENMLKWAATGLDAYRLVVFSDLDIDLMPAEAPPAHVAARWLTTWREVVPASRSEPRVFASSDHWSPFNGGLWTLAHPSRSLYAYGLDVLRSAAWNWTHGFHLMGRPRLVASLHAAGGGKINRDARVMLRGTRALSRNTWDFYCAEFDQGLFFHIFYVRLNAGRAFPPRDTSVHSSRCNGYAPARYSGAHGVTPEGLRGSCRHFARHFLGMFKPWTLSVDYRWHKLLNPGRVAVYLMSFEWQSLLNASACARHFARVLPKLEWWTSRMAERPQSNVSLRTVASGGNANMSRLTLAHNGHPQQVR